MAKEEKEKGGLPAVRGMFSNTGDLMEAFDKAAKKANLLAPVVRIDWVPPLHSVSLRIVKLDPRPPSGEDKGGGDVYQPEAAKGLALTKTALDKVAAAAGISWRADQTGRLDDASDPHYCRYRAVAVMTDFDGSKREMPGDKELDLRDGSGTVKGWGAARLARAREHIQSMAESKAKNRAIRSLLAIKASYTAQELKLPFVVPKLVFTGETDDPALQRVIAERIADRAMGLTTQVYGRGPGPADPRNITPTPPPAIDPNKADDDDGNGALEETECACPDAPAGRHLVGCALATPENSPKGGGTDDNDIPF